jgi:hypothetical protein
MYWRRPTAESLAGTAHRPEDFPEPTVGLWPDNEGAVNFYMRLSSQWRAGPGGLIGLDYGPLFHEMDRAGLDQKQYDDTLHCIRVIERAALVILNKG